MGKTRLDFRICIFFSITFLLGVITILYTNLSNVCMAMGVLGNFILNKNQFILNIRKDSLFLKWPLFFLAYLIIHTICLFIFKSDEIEYSTSVFEWMILYFILIPLYVCSCKDILTPFVLKRGMLFFTFGVILFNLALFFELGGSHLFSEPWAVIQEIAASRFGGNKPVFGGHVFLEPQALYINIAAIMMFFLMILSRNTWHKLGYIGLFFLLFFFLMLTETKSAFLSFVVGWLVLLVFFMRGKSFKSKIGLIVGIIGIAILLFFTAPLSLKNRFHQAGDELNNVMNNELVGGGTIMPRVAIYKVNFSHWKEFVFFGLGITERSTIKKWYDESEYRIAGLTDPHNSFVNYWLLGGIPGLAFVLGLFILPLYKMLKRKQFTFIMLSLLLVLFIPNNTTVLLSLNDSKPLIVFWLAVMFWGVESFRELESSRVIRNS